MKYICHFSSVFGDRIIIPLPLIVKLVQYSFSGNIGNEIHFTIQFQMLLHGEFLKNDSNTL